MEISVQSSQNLNISKFSKKLAKICLRVDYLVNSRTRFKITYLEGKRFQRLHISRTCCISKNPTLNNRAYGIFVDFWQAGRTATFFTFLEVF